jgi:hypothetical protein
MKINQLTPYVKLMELFFRSELAMRMPAATGKPSSGASIAFP